jgi:Transposase
VKRERPDSLANNPHFIRRFAFYVGRRCRQASIRDVAKELKLTWDTVKALEMQYMRAQIERAGTQGPKAIGIDEIAIRKGHNYRIVVSDLVRRRPIWFGGDDRSEASMAKFYAWLGHEEQQDTAHCHGQVEAVPQHCAGRGAGGGDPSTSSTSCAISARRSTRCATPNMRGCAARTGASSMGIIPRAA